MRQWRIPSISLCLGSVTDLINRHDQLVNPESGQQKDVEPSLVATIDIIVSHRFTSLNFSEMVSRETITPVKRITVSRQCNSDRPTRSPREHPARCVQQPGTSVLKHTWMCGLSTRRP